MLTIPFLIKGKIISIPDELLIAEKYGSISAGTHFHLALNDKYNMTHTFKILMRNGEPASGYMLGESFFRIKYIECSIEQFLKMKAFI